LSASIPLDISRMTASSSLAAVTTSSVAILPTPPPRAPPILLPPPLLFCPPLPVLLTQFSEHLLAPLALLLHYPCRCSSSRALLVDHFVPDVLVGQEVRRDRHRLPRGQRYRRGRPPQNPVAPFFFEASSTHQMATKWPPRASMAYPPPPPLLSPPPLSSDTSTLALCLKRRRQVHRKHTRFLPFNIE
jgi:hypothetical protein